MPIKTVKVGPGTLTIGAEDSISQWASQVTSCAVEPDSDIDDPVYVLSGESIAGKVSESFNLTGTILQDLGGTNSITEYTWAHSGETLPFTFTPATANGKSVSGQIVMLATKIGGDVTENADADFEFPCVGKPTIGAVKAPGA